MKKLLALALCAVMAVSMAACGKKNETPDALSADDIQKMIESGEINVVDSDALAGNVDIAALQTQYGAISHDAYVAAELNTEVKVVTFVQDKQGWWEKDGVGVATFYTQAPDGAYFIYNMPCSKEDYDKLVPGSGIVVTGFKSEWAGEVEIADVSAFEMISDSYMANATEIGDIIADASLVDHQNELVTCSGMTVEAEAIYNWDGSGNEGDDLYIKLKKGDTVVSFTVESYLRGADTDTYKAVKELKAGDTVDILGFLYWYEGAQMHITDVIKK